MISKYERGITVFFVVFDFALMIGLGIIAAGMMQELYFTPTPPAPPVLF